MQFQFGFNRKRFGILRINKIHTSVTEDFLLKLRSYHTLRYIFWLVVFVWLPAEGYCAEKDHVLVLHSYHENLPWTRDLTRGILSVLDRPGSDAEIHIEYMDNTRHRPDNILPELEALYKKKFSRIRFKIIIATDDIAFDFLLPRRTLLFPGVPIVFCGLNNFTHSRLTGHRQITGVSESLNIRGTIELALQLHPATRRVAVISDREPASLLRLSYLEEVRPFFKDRLEFILLPDTDLETIRKRLWTFPDDTVVLFFAFIREAKGMVHSTRVEVLRKLSNGCNLPFYACKEIDIGYGALGGYVISTELMARQAAEMAARILKGESADTIPILYSSPTVPMFDYLQLRRFNIRESDLPPGSVMVNRPFSFYREYRELVWTISGIITALSLFIIILSVNIIRRRRAEKELKKIRDALEQRVAERTSELAEINRNLEREIGERKQTEAALMESEIKFRSIFNLSPQAIALSEPDTGLIIDVNDHFCLLTRYTKEELLGMTLLERGLYHARSDRNRFLKALKESGVVDGMEMDFKIRNGSTVNLLMFSRIIHISEHPAILTIFIDVTRRNQIERHLRQTRRMEAIATLAGGIAHEFNNALYGITGNIELLMMKYPEDEAISKHLLPIQNASGRMNRLTSQLLAYAQGGKYSPQIISLNAFTEEVLSILSHAIPSDIRVETRLASQSLMIEVDLPQMQMALSAIISNASEAIDATGVIRVRTGYELWDEDRARGVPDAKPAHFAYICIEDTGRGMDEETRSRIFEPFFTTNFQGRGLGMAAVYGIAKNHDGWISVESEIGKGTAVCIYLPLTDLPATPDAEVCSLESTADSETVLLIEDEEIVMDVSREMLENLGYRVLAARNGKEAIELAQSFPEVIDLAILDIVLPDQGGKEIYPLLKAARPDMKVIVSSGYSLEGPAQEIIDEGAQGFIQKPYTFSNLSSTLKEVLEGQCH